MAGLARETETIELVVLISPITFRHPAVLAKNAATIQELYLSGRKREAEAAVPDGFLEATQLIGDEGFIRDRIDAYRASGVTRLDVTPIGADPMASVSTIKSLAG